MSLPHDRLIESWLADAGPQTGPPEALARALAATRRTTKRPRWSFPERWLPMQSTMARTPSSRPLLLIVAVALLATALVATALVVGSRRPALPAPFGPAGNGSVVFARDGDLYVADAVTATARPLVAGAEVDTEPQFSRQGDAIAFLRADPDGAQRIMRVAADGTGLRELAGPYPTVNQVTWSPDGSSLLVGFTDDQARLAIVDATDGGGRTLTVPADADSASWRPDGTSMVFRGRSRGQARADVYLADADGASVRGLDIPAQRSDFEDYWGLAWSPDGDALAFTRNQHLGGGLLGWQIGVAEVTKSGSLGPVRDLRLDPESTAELGPVWSPDGARLAYILEKHGTRQVAISPVDGSAAPRAVGPAMATDAGGFAYDWSPDGGTLLVSFLPRTGDQAFWSIDVASGEATPVTGWNAYMPSWQRVAADESSQ